MKKLKIYILALLVPILLMGCVEKGKPTVNVDVDVSNPYNFEQLLSMIENPDTKNEGSRLANNVIELKSLKNVSSIVGDTYKIQKIDTLTNILEQKVQVPIKSSLSTFNYTETLKNVTQADGELTSALNVKSLTQLEEIKAELDLWSVNFPNDANLYKIVNSLDITISTVKNRRSINPFYAASYRLYYQYVNNIGNDTNINYLKNTYGVDVINISKDPIIKAALVTITNEINQLQTNTSPVPIDPGEKAFILGMLKDIKATYEKYLVKQINFSDLATLRTVLKNYETGLLADGSASMVKSSMDKINNVYSQLKALTNPSNDYNTIELANKYITHINAYLRLNERYDKNEYSVITSKAVNILEELEYLNSTGADDLFTVLQLTKPW